MTTTMSTYESLCKVFENAPEPVHMTNYNYYYKKHAPLLKTKNPSLTGNQITMIISAMWKDLSREEKESWKVASRYQW